MEPPPFPDALIAQLSDRLNEEDAPFLKHLGRELSMEWLDEDSNRLGNTHFKMGHHELFKRRRLASSPGPITIGLNPILLGDDQLYRHTLVHELLHAVGILEHSEMHHQIVSEIAPAPSLSNSHVLRALRDKVLLSSDEKEWLCGNCGFEWERNTVRKPARCPKCARRI